MKIKKKASDLAKAAIVFVVVEGLVLTVLALIAYQKIEDRIMGKA